MSTISASTTSTTAYVVTADTTGALVLQTGATPTTALTLSSAQLMTLPNDATISGLTVGKGGGAVSTNTAVGASALLSNTSGANNQAFGSGALSSNTTGGTNSAFAQQSLGSNSTGSSNSAFGYQSLVNNTTASYNTAVGYQAGYSNSTTGGHNTFVGYQAGYTNTTADRSVYLGDNTGYSATGRGNTYIGCDAGYVMTSGASNTILGRFSGNASGIDIRTSSNYAVLADGDGYALIAYSQPTGDARRTSQSGSNSTSQYQVTRQQAGNTTFSLLTVSNLSTNGYAGIKVRVIATSPVNAGMGEITGYAYYGRVSGGAASGSVSSMTINGGVASPLSGGTLSWSGATLQYTTNAATYTFHSFWLETCQGDGATVTYATN